VQRIGDLMKDLGFNKESDEDTQKAFIRHLIQAANVSQFQRKSNKIEKEPVQLSFDFAAAETPTEAPTQTSTKVEPKQVG